MQQSTVDSPQVSDTMAMEIQTEAKDEDPSGTRSLNTTNTNSTNTNVNATTNVANNGNVNANASLQNAAPLPQPENIDGRSTRTGYVYDVRMRFHSNVHGEDDHPEDPRRIWRIYEALRAAGCTRRMIKVPSREATDEELCLVHTQEHVQSISKTSNMSKDELLKEANGYNSIYLNNSSAFCARLSCGSLLELCNAVATGQVLNGVAIVRPPGHHAEPDEAGGFCLYNNVAIAARDVHHGNGTQKAFIDDPDVVYCSIHRYDGGTFYPGDPVAAAHTTIGEGPGRGRNINIPWPCNGMGDSEYIYAFNKVVMPIVYEFAPDFILVSAGFDAAKGDHIGENLVTPVAYGHMTHMLKSLAGGKIILALEGGYNLDSIAVSGLACTKALLSDPIDALEPIVPNDVCVQTVHEVLEVQSRHWKSLTPMYIDPLEDAKDGGMAIELAKVLGVYRTEFLHKHHKMLKLPLSNPSYAKDFLDNVHVTPLMCHRNKPLYIFVHGIGEFCARTMGASNIIRPDKSVLVDSVAQYVDRIVNTDNDLIDIAVPYHPATEEEKISLKEKVTELLTDIWDTYGVLGARTRRIILLAAGFGCHSMVSFMNERQKNIMQYVSCVVLLPGGEESLPMVTRRLSGWYMEHSFVVLADNHPVWDLVDQKVNDRLGNLVRSGRSIERLSDQLLHLYNTTFIEINRKLKGLPPIPQDSEQEPTPMGISHSSGPINSVTIQKPSLPALSYQTVPESPKPGSFIPKLPGSLSPSLVSTTSVASRVSPARALVDRPTTNHSQRQQPYPSPNSRHQGVSDSPLTGTHGYERRTPPQYGYQAHPEQTYQSMTQQHQQSYNYALSSPTTNIGNISDGYNTSVLKQSGAGTAATRFGSGGTMTTSSPTLSSAPSVSYASNGGNSISMHPNQSQLQQQYEQHQQQQGYQPRTQHGHSPQMYQRQQQRQQIQQQPQQQRRP
ncbi:Histone deacetylase hda1 [Dissophora ornata]|nr:Histone deacetylase hda1 [Dissophora ornata]